MKLSRNLLAASLAALLFAPAAHAEITIDVIAGSEVAFEGLVQGDFSFFHNDKADLMANNFGDGRRQEWNFRRSELVLKGKGPGNNEWVIGYDAAANSGRGKWLDVNWKYKLGGNANQYVQFGQFKMPNSLEELSSTKNNDFISKANITNTFAVARRMGVAINYGDVNWGVTGAVFSRELSRNGKQGKGFGVRGYFAPINSDGNILHLGLSYNRYNAKGAAVGANPTDIASFGSKPNADLSKVNLIGTPTLTKADDYSITGFEAFYATGPLKFQGEYMRAGISRTDKALPNFTGKGGYISAVWNITGEKFGYKAGTPTTPLPNEPESGMFQIGLRYDTLDLNDGGVNVVNNINVPYGVLGGKMDTWTLGANWYWHSNFKFSLNYVKAKSSKYTGKTGATFSSDPAWNNRVVNGYLADNPSIIEGRVQFYW